MCDIPDNGCGANFTAEPEETSKKERKKKKNDDKIATILVIMETTTTKESNFPLPLLQIFFFLNFNFIAMLTA